MPASAQTSDSTTLKFYDVPDEYRPARGKAVAIGLTGAYAGTMGALYVAWYNDYPMSRFHTFNDNREWLQMDKVGHAGSVYYLSRWTSGIVGWTGLPSRKSACIGTATAWVFLLGVETFDGFSDQWGFSAGDMVANTFGAGLFLGQELAWKEQRITVKYSYHKDPLADVRPNIFGSTITENALKDYNGQTYWMSVNLKAFRKSSAIPAWLNLAVGYGAGGMLTAEENGVTKEGFIDPGIRYRQFYLSPDIDWTKIKTRRTGLKILFRALNFIKIPAPAIEYRDNGKLVLHGFYF
jgi:hypothetical protein